MKPINKNQGKNSKNNNYKNMVNTHTNIHTQINSYAYYVGIDIAKYSHTVSIVNYQGDLIVKNKQFSNTREGLSELYAYIQQYQQQGNISIGCEATGHYWLNLFHFLAQRDVTISVFNPLQVASFRNTKIRGNKTDSDDSVLITRVLRFGLTNPYQLPDEQRFELKELSRFRHDLSKQNTRVKLKIMHVLDQIFPEFTETFKDITGKTAQKILTDYPNPEDLENISIDDLTKLLEKVSHKQLSRRHAKQLKDNAKISIGLRFGLNAFTFQIKLLIQQIQNIEQQIGLIEERIKELVEASDTQLTSIPGISTIIAGLILGECNSFSSNGPNAFLAFAGLDPRKKESGTSSGKVKMSKRGNRYLRHALWLAASSARRNSPTFKQVYEKQKAKGKHYNVAISHVAKKMAYVVNSIMEHNEVFKERVIN